MLDSRTSQTNKLLLYLSLSVCLGVLIGTQITGLDTEKTFFNANFNKLRKIISYIEEDYVDEVAEDEMVESDIEYILVRYNLIIFFQSFFAINDHSFPSTLL